MHGYGRRHHGTARLRVGHHYSEAKYLDGHTVFFAPDARRDARWILGVDRGRVSNVTLVLEPRHGYARYHRYQQPAHRDWIAYQRGFNRYW